MEKKIYITEEERAKCKKVAEAFSELYEMADIVVVDVGRYGFVMLKYYMPTHGFEEDETYTDSRDRPVKEMDKEMDLKNLVKFLII
jgi:hypothetical protein